MPTVAGATPGQVGLGCLKKQTEQASEDHSDPSSGFLLEFHPDIPKAWTVIGTCKPDKPSPLQIALGQSLITSIEKQLG